MFRWIQNQPAKIQMQLFAGPPIEELHTSVTLQCINNARRFDTDHFLWTISLDPAPQKGQETRIAISGCTMKDRSLETLR